MRAAVALKPLTEVPEDLIQCIEKGIVDMVLVMTVEPGFGGQKFKAECLEKVRELRKKYHVLDVQVDGGVTVANVGVAAEAGANVIVSGTGILQYEGKGEEGMREAIQLMEKTVKEHI